MRPLFRPFILLSLGVAACSQTGVSTTFIPETALMVDPSQFLGRVTCGSTPDTMHAYVATVVDVSGFDRSVYLPAKARLEGGLQTLALPSSGPTSCFQSLLFQRIVIGRQYAAEIDGYDRSDITPLAPGSRVMVDAVTKNYVAPRWRTACSSHWSDPRRAKDGGAAAQPNTVPDAGPRADAGTPADAGTRANAGTPTDAGTRADGGVPQTAAAAATAPARVTVEGRPDAIAASGTDCRGHKFLDGGPPPWLDGPVCALQYETIPFKGCDPLADVR